MKYREDNIMSASHLPLLMRIIDISQGDMLELGTGYYSTVLFHWMGQMMKRHVYSYENNKAWYEKVKKYESEFHHIILIDDWNELPTDKHWGIIFVDQTPVRWRRMAIAKYAKDADYIVAHDTQVERQRRFHLERTLQTFKYRFDYQKLMPNTSVVSNFIDVTQLRL